MDEICVSKNNLTANLDIKFQYLPKHLYEGAKQSINF